jgi:hypothetical protein
MPERIQNCRIESFQQGLAYIGKRYDEKAKQVYADLIADGHTDKSIGFAIYKSGDKLERFIGELNFWGIFKNEILKWSWTRNDIRWQGYWEKKQIQKEIQEKEREYKRKIQQRQNHESVQKGCFPGYIYFMQGQNGGPVKIGFTKSVETRIKEIQTGHPDTLVCLDFFPGNMEMESLIHKDLSKYRIRPNGEWFKPDPYILARMPKYKERALQIMKEKEEEEKNSPKKVKRRKKYGK